MRGASFRVSFVMNAVPDDLVVSACGHATSYRKDQLPIEGFPQQLEHLVSGFVVRQVGGSMGAWEADGSSFAGVHAVVYDDGSTVFEAVAVHHFVDDPSHLAWRLVTDHLSENSGADRAADPVFVCFETVEASLMK